MRLAVFCYVPKTVKTGIDISNEMIKKARAANLENASFLKQDIIDCSTDMIAEIILSPARSSNARTSQTESAP